MMRKRILSYIGALLLFCSVFTGRVMSVSAAENRVFDYAGLFSEKEKETLEQTIQTAIGEMGMDLVLVTIDDAGGRTAEQYADDYYDEYGFGIGKELSGALCLIDMDNRELFVSTSGDMIRSLTDERIDQILDNSIGYLGDGEYADGAAAMIGSITAFVQEGIVDGQHNYDRETGVVSYYYKRSVTWYELLFALAAAGGVAFLSCAAVVRQYGMKSQLKRAGNFHLAYRDNSHFSFFVNNDLLINKTVTQRRIPKNTGSGSGGPGSSSGRSTTHSSSSGRSHGGGGRRF